VSLHSDKLLEHFQNPRNVGQLPPPAVTVEVMNPACGDVMRLGVRFAADGDEKRVAEVRYQVRGCTASIAAGSALTEWMLGKSAVELAEIKPLTVEEMLEGLQPASRHAAVLCADAVRMLLRAVS
jgi:nitrogen fixation NifU-like protein